MEESWALLMSKYVHQLNNVAGHIRAVVALVQMRRADLLERDTYLADELQKIDEDAKSVLSLPDRFKLSFSAPDSGEPVPVKEMLSHALRDSEPPQSVSVTLEVGEGIPEVRASRNLVDVFRNLAANAIEAMPGGGELHVSAKVNQSKKRLEVTFSDTGRGMPAYVADSLFQPYFSTKRDAGHGLGLWWSKTYLESIGGNVELLRSEVGKGSVFLVTLAFAETETTKVT